MCRDARTTMNSLPFPPRPLHPLRCNGLCPSRWFHGGVPVVVLFLALLIRVGVLVFTPAALRADPDGYRRLAENLVEHGTFGVDGVPTAFRPPLYPLMLAGCVALGDYGRLAIGALHVTLGVATVGLVLVLGRWWGLGNRGSAIAALLVACDPILLAQSAQVMTETPAVFLATAGLAALTWASQSPTGCRLLLAGATLSLGALCRPTLLLWTIAAGVVLFLSPWATGTSEINSRRLTAPGGVATAGGVACKCRWCVAYLLGASIVLSPWAIRNQLQFRRPIVTTTHGGYTLLLANNPEFYQWLRSGQWGSVWQADRFNADWNQRKPHDELRADRRAYAEAWQTIRRAPGTFAYACLVRVGRFWSPLPHQVVSDETSLRRWSRYAVAAWYVAEFLLMALGLVGHLRSDKEIPALPSALRPPPSPWLWGLLLVVCLTSVHAVFWTDMRMRAPLMPVVAMIAAAGLSMLSYRHDGKHYWFA